MDADTSTRTAATVNSPPKNSRLMMAPAEAYKRLAVVFDAWMLLATAKPTKIGEVDPHVQEAVGIVARVAKLNGATMGQLRRLEAIAASVREATST